MDRLSGLQYLEKEAYGLFSDSSTTYEALVQEHTLLCDIELDMTNFFSLIPKIG